MFKNWKRFGGHLGRYAVAYGAKKFVRGAIGYGARAAYRRWNNKKYGRAQGFYQGPFPKPTRKGVKQPKVDTKCLTKGYQKTSEIYGIVSDPDCVYVGHSTWNREYMSKTITGALLRKLLLKGGFSISSTSEPLIHPEIALSSVQYRVEFQTINPNTAAVATYQASITITTSLEDLISTASFMYDWFSGYLGLSQSNDPYMMYLSMQDVEDTTSPAVSYRPIADLPLQNEVMHLYINSRLKVQNRTLGATAGSGVGDADRVDAQPLNGRLYNFKNADPRLTFLSNQTNDSDFRLNRIPETGSMLVRAAQFTTDNYRNPPMPKTFANISGASFISLEPGAIKTSKIGYKFTGKLVNVLKLMRPVSSGTYPAGPTPPAESGYSGIRGRMALVALQERLTTVTTNKIVVSYERQLDVGCYFVTKRPNVLLSTYGEDSVNNEA